MVEVTTHNSNSETISFREMPHNYIYISHLKNEYGSDGTPIENPYFVIPTDPDSISDSVSTSWHQTNALGRTAPVQTYENSGPRSVQFQFKLHRDMMNELNADVSNYNIGIGENYVDTFVRVMQSIAYPNYNDAVKLVNPATVAIRIGNQLFIKGVVTSGVTVAYEKPMLWPDNKYAVAVVSFTVQELDPYDSSYVYKNGSFRGMTRTLASHMGGALT